MKNLFSYELSKFFRQKSLYILFAAMIAFGAILTMLINAVESASDELGQMGFGVLPISTITTFQVVLFLGIFSAIYVTGDFTSHVIKNVYARGYTRVQVGLVKFCFLAMTAVAFCLVALAVNFLSAPSRAIEETSGKSLGLIALQVLSVVSYAALYYCLASVCGKGAIAVCIAIPYIYVVVQPLAELLLYDKKNLKFIIDIINFLPMGLPEMLSDAALASWKIALAAALSCAYTAGFVTLGLLAVRKKEA